MSKYIQLTRTDHSPIAVIQVDEDSNQEKIEAKFIEALSSDFDAEITLIDFPPIEELFVWLDSTIRFRVVSEDDDLDYINEAKISTTWLY